VAARAENKLITRVKLVVNVGYEFHVAGGTDIFLAARIGLAQRAEGFAFMPVSQTIEILPRLERHG
jgi:hypothetical protein